MNRALKAALSKRTTNGSPSPRYHPANEPRPPTLRSKVTNGNALYVVGSSQSPWSRRYRDLLYAHCKDAGGADALSEAQLSLIKRASAIELELERMEGKLSMGEPVNLDEFGRAASHLRRLWEAVG